MILGKIRTGLKSSKNMATLVAGNSLGQIITFISAPILARLFTPEEFGVMAVFMSIGQILIVLSSLGYEIAIVLPEKDRDSILLVRICIFISLFLSILLYVPIFFCKNFINCVLNTDQVYKFLFFIPLYVFAGSLFNVLNYYNTRFSNYPLIAKSNIIKSIFNNAIPMSWGLLRSGAFGLVLGQISMNLFGNVGLLKFYNKNSRGVKAKWDEYINIFKRYKNFPQFYVAGAVANSAALNVANILISKLYSIKDVGYYSYAYKYVAFPLTLVSSSISQVYYQELVAAKNNNRGWKVFTSTLSKILVIGIPIFLAIYFLIEPAFVLIFGEPWRVAGIYGKILIPLFFMRFIVSPLSMTLIAYEKQKLVLLWQLGLLVMTCVPFMLAILSGLLIHDYLLLFSFTNSIYYLLYFCIISLYLYRKTH